MIVVLAYVGDALSILALSIMFSLSLSIARADPKANRARVWTLPVVAAVVTLPLGYLARTWPGDGVDAGLVLGARALLASLFALAHLNAMQRRG